MSNTAAHITNLLKLCGAAARMYHALPVQV
jgi:hypothetical protein